MHKQFYPRSYARAGQPSGTCSGLNHSKCPSLQKRTVCEYKCVYAHECTLTNTHKCVLSCSSTSRHNSHFQPLCQSDKSIIRAKINSTMSASPLIAWPKKVRFDYSIDQQSHTYCPIFTGKSKPVS